MILVFAVALAVLGVASSKQSGESPFDQTFLRHRSFKTVDQIRSLSPLASIRDARQENSGAVLTVSPAQLMDGQDAFVSFSGIPNPSPQDYVTVSCGATNGVDDFLDAVYVGPFISGSITNITFAVGDTAALAICPEGFIQNNVDLNDGAGGKVIHTCFSFNPEHGQPIASITGVQGDYENTSCPDGFVKVNQDLNEGTTQHQYFIYLCLSYEVGYSAGVNDVENLLIYSVPNFPEQGPPNGYLDSNQNYNSGTAGNSISILWKQGNSSVNMPNAVQFPNLINMRCNYTFSYINVNEGIHEAIASVTVPMIMSPSTPNQIHIALTGNIDEMAIIYVSASQSTPSVRYGILPNSLSLFAIGTTSTYTATDICENPANITAQEWFRDPGFIHTITLNNLTPGTTYFYQCGNDEDGWSQVFSFNSLNEQSIKNVGFIAYADMGVFTPPSSQSTAMLVNQDIDSGQYNFLLHFGDLAYARGQAWIWEYFFHMIQPYAARIPYMVSVGNHEYDYYTGGDKDPSHAEGSGFHPTWGDYLLDSSGECAVPVAQRFVSPQNGNGIFWYSFDVGSVHVVQISTEHSWLQGSQQYLWLQQDLQSVNRSQTPWVVLTGHRMMYTTQLQEEGDYIVSVHMREEMEELLYENQVNLMLVGHQHSYERTCMVYRNECLVNNTGTVHIVIGTSGAGLESGGFSNSFGNFSLVHLEDWGYLRVFATESTLTTEFVLNEEGSVVDSFTLYPWGSPQNNQHQQHQQHQHQHQQEEDHVDDEVVPNLEFVGSGNFM